MSSSKSQRRLAPAKKIAKKNSSNAKKPARKPAKKQAKAIASTPSAKKQKAPAKKPEAVKKVAVIRPRKLVQENQNSKKAKVSKPKQQAAAQSKAVQSKAVALQQKAAKPKKPEKVKKVASFISENEKEYRNAKRQKSTADGSRYYVTNKLLLEEMIKWRDSNKEEEDMLRAQGREDEIDYTKRVISEKLGEMIRQIAIRLTNHSYFRNYTKEMKEDMIGHACLKIIKGLKGYKFKYTNVFAYFTTACFNSFKAECLKHYKQINISNALKEDYICKLDCEMPNSSISKALKRNLSIFDGPSVEINGYNNSIDDND